MTKKVLVTGGAGFVGHHCVEHFFKNTDWEIVILDRLDTSGNLNRLTSIDSWEKYKHRVKFVWHDLKAPINDGVKNAIGRGINYVFHLAAGSHVDRSIENPLLFAMDNTIGTVNLLDYVKTLDSLEKFNYFSTDEVMGSAPEGTDYKEIDMCRPENPYAGSKLGAEAMCHSYACTYKVPIFITRTMNIYGARQDYEKFIPGSTRKILLGEKILVHGTPDLKKAGSRFYIHARNVVAALLFLLEKGELLQKEDRTKGIYNIVGDKEIDNLTLIKMIYDIVKEVKSDVSDLQYEIINFHQQRPGHDLRYALDGSKLKQLGFEYPKTFEQSFEENILWMIKKENLKWLNL